MKLKHPIFGPLIKDANDIVYVVSDLHLNHNKEFLWKARSGITSPPYRKVIVFDNCSEYTEWVLRQLEGLATYHKHKGDKAYLISLGDNCFNDSEYRFLDRFASLPFEQIYSLAGNHCSGLNSVFANTENIHYKNLTLIGSNIPLRIKKNFFVQLSHFPIMDWDNSTYGVLCGHCHGSTKALQEDNDTFGKIFDCGVDNALRLFGRSYFKLEECINILSNKTSYNENQIHAKRKIAENFVDEVDDR